jgi:hypothetical protein
LWRHRGGVPAGLGSRIHRDLLPALPAPPRQAVRAAIRIAAAARELHGCGAQATATLERPQATGGTHTLGLNPDVNSHRMDATELPCERL